MNAEIISVGTELLLGNTVNTDTTIIARELSRLGIALRSRRSRDRRELTLTHSGDGNDGSDGKNDMEPVPDLLSQPSQLSRSHAVSSNERRANK